jgi:hypothetical protein
MSPTRESVIGSQSQSELVPFGQHRWSSGCIEAGKVLTSARETLSHGGVVANGASTSSIHCSHRSRVLLPNSNM